MIDKRNVRSLSNIVKGGVVLGSGQATARVASLILVAYLARRLSVEMFGELILGQAIARYITIGTDMGSKFVGARLIAKAPDGTSYILGNLQRKRTILALVSVSLAIVYALEGPVLPFARGFLVLFSISFLPYALAIDWVPWGLKRFLPMSAYQAGTAFLLLGFAVIFLQLLASHLLDWFALANGLALLVGAGCLWIWWRGVRAGPALQAIGQDLRVVLRREARWSAVFILGLAAAFNVAFQCLDILLLGGLSTGAQVAQYGAAYKVLNVVLSAFWLFTTAAYPFMARVRWSRRKRLALAGTLACVGVMGLAVAVCIRHFAPSITLLLFGAKYVESGRLLHFLLWAIPLDFVSALCATALVSSGRNNVTTTCVFFGLVANLGLNLKWIPKYGAMGAAWATVLSYAVLAAALFVPAVLRGSPAADGPTYRSDFSGASALE